MEIFILLLAAHVVADYPLQTDWVYLQKIKSYLGGSWHAGVTFGVHALFLLPYIEDIRVLAVLAISVLFHQAQDYIKIIICERPRRQVVLGYIIDQGIHVTAAGVMAYIFTTQLTPSLSADPALTFFWHNPLIAGGIATVVVASFMAEVTLFVMARAKDVTIKLERDYRAMLLRGAIAGALYCLAVFIRQTWM